MFTLEKVNREDNLSGLSTTLLSKHMLQRIYISICIPINNYQISRNSQALGHNQVSHLSNNEGGVMDCANSKINNVKLYTIMSHEIIFQYTRNVYNTDKLLCCLFCPTIYPTPHVSYGTQYLLKTRFGWFN